MYTETNPEPKIMQVFLGGCQEIPEVKIRVRTPGLTIERANLDIEITKPPNPTPTPTPKPKAVIKPTPTSFGDEVSYEDGESRTGTFASVTDETDFHEMTNFDATGDMSI